MLERYKSGPVSDDHWTSDNREELRQGRLIRVLDVLLDVLQNQDK
jgi:hypothetical protein